MYTVCLGPFAAGLLQLKLVVKDIKIDLGSEFMQAVPVCKLNPFLGFDTSLNLAYCTCCDIYLPVFFELL